MSEKMKDSGIEWIGKIPLEWELGKISNFYKLRNTKVSDREYSPLSVTMNGVVPQLENAAKTNAHDDRKLVLKNDFAINSRSDRRGSCGISKYDGSVSLINIVMTPRANMNPYYYDWLFHTKQFSDEYYRWGHGIVADLWTTNWSDMKKITIPNPPLFEQKCIADFLDSKCAKIDELKETIQKQIELLQERKQAVIMRAVTKGIDSNVSMKDSGIDWIGGIPKDASISRVGLHYEIILGKMLCSQPKDRTYTLEPYFCAANVHFEGITYDKLKTMWFSTVEKQQYLVEPGDLLVVEGGAGAGGCAIVPEIEDKIYIQNSIMIVRSENNNNCTYLKYLIEYGVKLGYIDIACNKATIPHFTKEKLSRMPFVLFSTEQQKKIADYLDSQCEKIDSLISIKQQELDKLEEYKKSLIYEYVTGKKRVKGAAEDE